MLTVQGKFVKAAIKNYPSYTGKRIYAATEYYTPSRIVEEFSEVIGAPASFVQIPAETFKSFLPDAIAEEMCENILLLEDTGYYGGVDLKESLELLDEAPTTWKSFA